MHICSAPRATFHSWPLCGREELEEPVLSQRMRQAPVIHGLPLQFSTLLYSLTFPLCLGLSPFHLSLSFLFICPFALSGEALFAATTIVYFFGVYLFSNTTNVCNIGKNLVTYIAHPKISIKHFNLQFPELNDDITTFQNC